MGPGLRPNTPPHFIPRPCAKPPPISHVSQSTLFEYVLPPPPFPPPPHPPPPPPPRRSKMLRRSGPYLAPKAPEILF